MGQYTARLSELLSDEVGSLILATLQKLQLSGEPRPKPIDVRQHSAAHIGVWRVVETPSGASLHRDPRLSHDHRRWADIEAVPPKKGPRVVLLGESAARGYLFDPVLTFAGLVERALRTSWEAAGERGPFPEVVDLAKAGATLSELHHIAELLPILRPDAVLLFAGNNWANLSLNVPELDHLAGALRMGGYPEARRQFLERILVPRSLAVLEALASSARANGFTVVVIVPEFNLLDWQTEPGVIVPILVGGAFQKWMKDRAVAENALAQGDHETALQVAQQMIVADADTSAISHSIAGRALIGLGRGHDARRHLESARDALCGSFLKHTPRCPVIVQETLRSFAKTEGFRAVDMPALFCTELERGIPGRRLFMDYCHPTLKGLRILATATARELTIALGAHAPAIPLVDPLIAPEDEGVAHVLAALHCAHYGQSSPVLEYHCQRAARLSGTARSLMEAFLDFESRSAPHWMCASYHRASEHPMVRRYLAATVPKMIDKLADFALRDAMLLALENDAVRRSADDRQCEQQGQSKRVDLLAYRNRATTFRARDGYSRVSEKAYVQSTDLISRFFLIRARSEPMQLVLTHRAPMQESEVPIALHVNGVIVATSTTAPTWRTWSVLLSREFFATGINVVEIHWSLVEPAWEAEVEKAARRMEMGGFPDVLPIFGELHSFVAIAGPDDEC